MPPKKVSHYRRFRVVRKLLEAGWRIGLTGLVVGLLFGFFVGLRWVGAVQDPQRFGDFLGRFFTSAGAGGAATVIAAALAVGGVTRQVRHTAAASQVARRTAEQETKNTEWWKSFEWTTARLFPTGDQGNSRADEGFAVQLVNALEARAYSTEQKIACDVLLGQVSTQSRTEVETPSDEDAAIAALTTYLAQSESREILDRADAISLRQARSRLLDLHVYAAMRALREEGVVGSVHKDSNGDIEVSVGGNTVELEMRSYPGEPTPVIPRIMQRARRDGKHQLWIIQAKVPDGYLERLERHQTPAFFVPPEVPNATEYMVENLRQILPELVAAATAPLIEEDPAVNFERRREREAERERRERELERP